MFSKYFRILVAILMTISPTLTHLFGLPAIPNGQELQLEERFNLVWPMNLKAMSLTEAIGFTTGGN